MILQKYDDLVVKKIIEISCAASYFCGNRDKSFFLGFFDK